MKRRNFASHHSTDLGNVQGRGGDASAQGVNDDRVFRVHVSRNDDGSSPSTYDVGRLMNALGFVVGAVHPSNAFAVLKSIKPKNDKAPDWWIVTISYSTLSADRKDESDPGLDPIQISISEEKFTRPAGRNRLGEVSLTSAGTLPDPPHMVEDSNRIITIEGSHAGTGFPSWENEGFRNSINNTAFELDQTGRIVPVKMAKCRSITIGKVDYRGGDGALPFRPFKIELEVLDFEEPNWDDRDSFLDAAYQRKATAQDVTDGIASAVDDLIDIILPGGGEPRSPVLLNGSGQPLSAPTPATAQWNEAKQLYLKNFTGLPGCVSTS